MTAPQTEAMSSPCPADTIEQLQRDSADQQQALGVRIAELEYALEIQGSDLATLEKTLKERNRTLVDQRAKIGELTATLVRESARVSEQTERWEREVERKDRLISVLTSSDKAPICAFCRKFLLDPGEVSATSKQEIAKDAYAAELEKRSEEQAAEITRLQESLDQSRRMLGLVNRTMFSQMASNANSQEMKVKSLQEKYGRLRVLLQGALSQVCGKMKEFSERTETRLALMQDKLKHDCELVPRAVKEGRIGFRQAARAGERLLFVPHSPGVYLALILNATDDGEEKAGVRKTVIRSTVMLDMEKMPDRLRRILLSYSMLVIGVAKRIYGRNGCGHLVCELERVEHIVRFEGEDYSLTDYEFTN